MPSYLISDFEIRLILVPIYGIPVLIVKSRYQDRKRNRMALDGLDFDNNYKFSLDAKWRRDNKHASKEWWEAWQANDVRIFKKIPGSAQFFQNCEDHFHFCLLISMKAGTEGTWQGFGRCDHSTLTFTVFFYNKSERQIKNPWTLDVYPRCVSVRQCFIFMEDK